MLFKAYSGGGYILKSSLFIFDLAHFTGQGNFGWCCVMLWGPKGHGHWGVGHWSCLHLPYSAPGWDNKLGCLKAPVHLS